MAPKGEQPAINDLFDKERHNGETLISRLRLFILLGFVPVLYVIRFFVGYIRLEFIPLVVGKWLLMCIMAYAIYRLLQRGYYRQIIGYLTITLDLAFITVSVIMLSFYKNMATGAMNDPVFILYYLVGISSVLRYNASYVVYTITAGIAIIASLAAFDIHYFHIPLDVALLIDRIAAFVFFTVLGVSFTKIIKESIVRGYTLMERHLKVIDAILDIGKKIASHSELNRSLKTITIKARELLQFDVSWMVLNEGSTWRSTLISGDSLPNSFNDPALIRAIEDNALGDYLKKPGLMFNGRMAAEIAGTRIMIGQGVVGALLAARFDGPPKTYNHSLLCTLAEQAAICLENARLLEQLKKETVYLHRQLDDLSRFENIIGTSPVMREVFALIDKVAITEIPVLILGESGTGKELVAQALHGLSQRKEKPFIKINCAAIPAELLESELFGHEKGAFTGATKTRKGRFELANGGTLFLDEIGDMDIGLQSKLLRILQEQEFERVGGEVTIRVDVRLITATNQNLEEKIKRGGFREDLFYRINTLPIRLPALRDRREDIPLLVRHFLKRFSDGKNIELTRSAMEYLTGKEWKGNVRELQNLIKRLLIITDKEVVSEEEIRAIDLGDEAYQSEACSSAIKEHIRSQVRKTCSITQELERIEMDFISEAMSLSGGNLRKAATVLGIPKSTLFNKIKKHEIKA